MQALYTPTLMSRLRLQRPEFQTIWTVLITIVRDRHKRLLISSMIKFPSIGKTFCFLSQCYSVNRLSFPLTLQCLIFKFIKHLSALHMSRNFSKNKGGIIKIPFSMLPSTLLI